MEQVAKSIDHEHDPLDTPFIISTAVGGKPNTANTMFEANKHYKLHDLVCSKFNYEECSKLYMEQVAKSIDHKHDPLDTPFIISTAAVGKLNTTNTMFEANNTA
jgi:hypothetical protein